MRLSDGTIILQKKGRYSRRWSEHTEDRIADAIEKDYPDRTAAIWKGLAERQISLTKPSAYEAAAIYLKKLHSFFAGLNRVKEWTSYLGDIRQAHARKPRLLQTIARLEGRKIIFLEVAFGQVRRYVSLPAISDVSLCHYARGRKYFPQVNFSLVIKKQGNPHKRR